MFGEAAREALKFAKDAYERVVKSETAVNGLAESVHKFEQRLTAALEAHRREFEQRLHQHEERTAAQLRDFESRLRELERRASETDGKVTGVLAESLKVLMSEKSHRDGVIKAVIDQPREERQA